MLCLWQIQISVIVSLKQHTTLFKFKINQTVSRRQLQLRFYLHCINEFLHFAIHLQFNNFVNNLR